MYRCDPYFCDLFLFPDFAAGVLLPLLVTESELVRAALSEVGRLVDYGWVGSAVPDFDWTSPMSELLIAPLTVTSSRKLLAVTGCPDWD
jgi:hypothetical protein